MCVLCVCTCIRLYLVASTGANLSFDFMPFFVKIFADGTRKAASKGGTETES